MKREKSHQILQKSVRLSIPTMKTCIIKRWKTQEMDRVLDMIKSPKLNQEDIKILNNLIIVNDIENVIKNVTTKKNLSPHRFKVEFYKKFREELMPLNAENL